MGGSHCPTVGSVSSSEPRQAAVLGQARAATTSVCFRRDAHGPKPPSTSPKHRQTCSTRRKQCTPWLVRNAPAHPCKVTA